MNNGYNNNNDNYNDDNNWNAIITLVLGCDSDDGDDGYDDVTWN